MFVRWCELELVRIVELPTSRALAVDVHNLFEAEAAYLLMDESEPFPTKSPRTW